MKSPGKINQLVLVIVSGTQAGDLMQRLTQSGYYFTKIESTRGVLQEPTVCILIGLHTSHVVTLLELVRQVCKPYQQYIPAHLNLQPGYSNFPMIEAQLGGALVFMLNVERFIQI